MTVLCSIFILGIIFLLTDYCVYRIVFYLPKKKRPDFHNVPESNLYKAHREKMLECVKDMEQSPYEEITIQSKDGYLLNGRLYHVKKDAPLMIFFHVYHGTFAWDGYGCYKICKENDINILMVDERAHGKSDSNVITFGLKERYDCKLWTEYAVKRFGENVEIFLAGVSMGAASVLMATELGLVSNVKGIVADCGFTSPQDIIKENIKQMKLPVKPVYVLVKIGAYLFGHFDLVEASSYQAVKRLNIPVLFIHGEQDSVVPVSMNHALYEACNGKKSRIIIEGADHANSALTDYEAYKKAVLEFLREY